MKFKKKETLGKKKIINNRPKVKPKKQPKKAKRSNKNRKTFEKKQDFSSLFSLTDIIYNFLKTGKSTNIAQLSQSMVYYY